MHTEAELLALATDLESELVERKESSRDREVRDRIAQAICAFANDLPGHRKPGVVFVGLRDDGVPSGLEVTDHLLQQLANLAGDGAILPRPTVSVGVIEVQGQKVATVQAEPADDTPVRFKELVWIRVGPRLARATREQERVLTERRRAADLPFDSRPRYGAQVADLDLDLIRRDFIPRAVDPEVLEENHRSLEEQLAALHLTSPEGVPTNAALLLFGREPRRWFPGGYVQFIRLEGVDWNSEILDQKEIDGPIPQMLRRLDDIALANIRIATEVGGELEERRRPDYALVALQQLLGNALLHRTYELSTNAYVKWVWFRDRIEISSPGGPFGIVNTSNFGEDVNDYRNPQLAAGLKILKLVQRFGLGLRKAREACEQIGSPPPEFKVTNERVVVTVFARRGRALLSVDTVGSLQAPPGPPVYLALRAPRGASPTLDEALRRYPLEGAQWRQALEDVEREVLQIASSGPEEMVVSVQAPYPLAAWVGRCLDRHARGRRVVLAQRAPDGSEVSLFVPGQVSGREVAGYAPIRVEPGVAPHRGGVLLVLEGPRALADAARDELARATEVSEILILSPGREVQVFGVPALLSACAALRAALTQILRRHPDEPIHVVTTAPAAIMVELGRILASAAAPVLIYVFDPSLRAHRAVLDISSGRVLD